MVWAILYKKWIVTTIEVHFWLFGLYAFMWISSRIELKGASSLLTQSISHSEHATHLVIGSCWGFLHPLVWVLTSKILKGGYLDCPRGVVAQTQPIVSIRTWCVTLGEIVSCSDLGFMCPGEVTFFFCRILKSIQKIYLKYSWLKIILRDNKSTHVVPCHVGVSINLASDCQREATPK